MLVFRVYSPHQNRTKKSLPFITGTIFTWQLTPFHPIKRPPQLHHVEVISAAHASRVGASSAGNVEKSGHLSWRVCERLTADPIAPTVNKVNGWFNLKRSSSKYHQRLLDQLKLENMSFKFANRFPIHFASMYSDVFPSLYDQISPTYLSPTLSVELLKPMSSLDWKDRGRWKS